MNKNPIVFTDFHHASLLQSFILLFENRLGGQVYRPIGTEWFEQGFWKIYDHPATVQQFLGIGAATPDGSAPLNEVLSTGQNIENIQFYNCQDIDSGQYNKAIVFDEFMKAPIDIVIASIPDHIELFKRLCELHPNKPKLIYQIGNQWNMGANVVKNVMASATIDSVPEGVNFIQYHQEFDTRIFHPCNGCMKREYHTGWSGHANKNIFSFVNVFNGQANFWEDWQLFQQLENHPFLHEWNFKSYGGQCRDGAIGPASALAEEMRKARFIWHTKNGGDGYGHVIHNAAAVGRPLIVKKEYYRGKMADDLLIDGETCVAIDNLSVSEIVNKIEFYNDPERYYQMSLALYNRFCQIVDFDREAEQIKIFLQNLK